MNGERKMLNQQIPCQQWRVMQLMQEEAIHKNTNLLVLSIAGRKIKPSTAIKPRLSPPSGNLQKFQGLVRTISNILCKKLIFFPLQCECIIIHFLFNSGIKQECMCPTVECLCIVFTARRSFVRDPSASGCFQLSQQRKARCLRPWMDIQHGTEKMTLSLSC